MVAKKVSIEFSHPENSIQSRANAQALGQKISLLIKEGAFVEFNFKDVKLIPPSFCNTLFGGLIEEYGLDLLKQRTTFTNVSAVLAETIKFTIHQFSLSESLA